MNASEEITLKEFVDSEKIKTLLGNKYSKYLQKWKKNLLMNGGARLTLPKIEKEISGIIGWNWSAFFFSYYWGIWRGVIGSWIIFIFVMSAIIISAFFPESWFDKATDKVGFFINIGYGVYGNAFYLRTLVRERHRAITELAPSSRRLVIALAITIAVVTFAALIMGWDDIIEEFN